MNTTKSGDEKYVKANYEPPQENPQRPHPNAQGRSIRSRTEDIRTPMWLYPWECYSSQHFDCTCHYAKPTSLRVGCVSIQVRCRSFSFDQATFPWMHEAFWHQASRTTCSNSSCGSMNKTTQNKPINHTKRWTQHNQEMKEMGKKKSRADKEGTSSLAASMKALYDDMVARGYPPSTTTTNTKVKVEWIRKLVKIYRN